jgi:hypothetical protein
MSFRAAPLLACALTALVPLPAASAQQGQVPSAPTEPMPCVEVRIGQDRAGSLDCLNRALRAEVDKVAPTVVSDTTSGAPPSRLGLATPAAAKERLGNAYGHSLVPQRPPRTFTSPLVPKR